jgi:WD40 repeat protein
VQNTVQTKLKSSINVGHTGRIFSLALTTLKNGRRIAASASHDRTVKIWCLDTSTELRTLQFPDFVWRVFLVHGSRALVVAFISAEDRIIVSDVETGERVHEYSGRLVFAGNVSLYQCPIVIMATGEEDIAIIEAETGDVIREIRGGFEKVFRAVVSHGELPILAFTTWNAQNRRSTIQTFDLTAAVSNRSINSSSSSSKEVDETALESCVGEDSISGGAASGTGFGSLTAGDVYDYVDEGPRPRTSSGSKSMHVLFEGDSRDGVTSLVASHTNKPLMCSGHYDFMVRVWDLVEKKLLLILEGHTDWVVSVALWKGPEPLVVSGSSDGTIKVWNVETGSLTTTCEGHLRDVWSVTVTQGPQPLIVSASSDRTVRTWDINDQLLMIKYEENWSRRRLFCLFLCGCGLLCGPHRAEKTTILVPAAVAEAFDSTPSTERAEGIEKTVEELVSNMDVSLHLVGKSEKTRDLLSGGGGTETKQESSGASECRDESEDRRPCMRVLQTLHLCREIVSFL